VGFVVNRGQVMPGIHAGTLTVPICFAGAAAAVFVAAILLAANRVGGVGLITLLFCVGLFVAVVLDAWLFVQQRDFSERRALHDRKMALMAGSIAPGSALSCLDELAGEAVEAACEKGVFASPEAVAAAVKYVAAQLALLEDGTTYAKRSDASYATELAPLRAAIELDRFGVVAQVLKEREGCTVDRCDALTRFRESARVLENLRDRTFDMQVEKYTAIWNAPRPAGGVVAAAGPSVALAGTNGAAADSPRDPAVPEPALESAVGSVASPPHEPLPLRGSAMTQSQELPPLLDSAAQASSSQSAVAPPAGLGSVPSPPQEPPPLRGSVTPGAAEPALQPAGGTPPPALGSVTPLPPRRPLQGRTARPRAAAPP
jgi:hypothetical protein